MAQPRTKTAESKQPSAHTFRLGAWTVEPANDRITNGETSVRIEPKAMDVLVYLASHEDEVVSREDLERDVWRGAVVGYDAITSTVIKLRKALGDDARQPRYIATVPKRGYRLLPGCKREAESGVAAPAFIVRTTGPRRAARVSWPLIISAGIGVVLALTFSTQMLNRSGTALKPGSSLVRTDDIPSLAVLPFANIGGDLNQQYIIDGLTQDVITDLSKIAALRVIAHNSAFAFAGVETDPREAAAQLGVRYILQGSVRSSGEKLRVTAKLIDTDSGVHVWGEQFDGSVRDLFTLQDRVAEQTAAALSVKVTENEKKVLSARPTTNFDAYDLYLRGRVIYGALTSQENALARSMYRRAIEKDPNFAQAFAGLALTYIDDFRRGWGHDSEVAATEALAIAERAVSLDRSLPQAHFAVGYVRLYVGAEYEHALAAARQALELDPNYADAYALLSSVYYFAGDIDKTLELDREAMRLNPAASFIYHVHLGRTYYLKGQYENALDAFLIAVAKNYNDVPAHAWLTATYAKLGDLDEAEWAAEQLKALAPKFSIEGWMRHRPYKNREHRERLMTGLNAAGL